VSDRSCLACHDGPVHHKEQAFDSACTTCHVEHKGHVVLASISSPHCTQCHADLKTKGPGPATIYERKIESFAASHPEFAVTVKEGASAVRVRLDDAARLRDGAQVKLNHQVHLEAGLRHLDEVKAAQGSRGIIESPDGLKLACTFCHQPDGQQSYMEPISYAKHCGPICHGLDFDRKLLDFDQKPPVSVVAPHDTPAVVHAFVRTTYAEAFEACQDLAKPGAVATSELTARCQQLELIKGEAKTEQEDARPRGRRSRSEEPEDDRPRGRVGRPAEPEDDRPRGRAGRREEAEDKPAPAAGQWVPMKIVKAESELFENKCVKCHFPAEKPQKLAEFKPTAIPVRWLPHSRFDHGAHRPLACTQCHGAALKSRETTDVLLPKKAICRECHRDAGGARSGCVECHLYHDKTKARDQNGPLTIRQLTGGSVPGGR
jgi:hypothetical protein